MRAVAAVASLLLALSSAGPLQAQPAEASAPEQAAGGKRTFALDPAMAWVETLKLLSDYSIVPVALDRAGGTVIAEGITANELYVSCSVRQGAVQNVKVKLSVILTPDSAGGTMVILIVSGSGDRIQPRNSFTERPEKLIPVGCISLGVLEQALYDSLSRAATGQAR